MLDSKRRGSLPRASPVRIWPTIDNPSEQRLMLPSITIRAAVPADASCIATRLAQLGYPATPEQAAAQLAHLQEFPHATALVAELQGQVIGLVTGHVFPSIHDAALVAWLTTLVIDEQHLQKGVGRLLSAAIESWANGHGAARVSVTSGKHRDGAHAFYERIGYQRTGLRLTKVLTSISETR
jgi:GNAT superfamily N-acetyltransferase